MAKEIPILFSTPMVQAILDGRKTETRRVVSKEEIINAPDVTAEGLVHFRKSGSTQLFAGIKPKWAVGDVLWVRETFCLVHPNIPLYYYKATNDHEMTKWKPSIHMPKDAARIWLEVVSIGVERLWDISEESAKAEGVGIFSKSPNETIYKMYGKYSEGSNHCTLSAIDSFLSLWRLINGPGSLKTNPWVWVVKFKVLSTTGKPANL